MHETIHSNFFKSFLNTRYLPEEDKYICKDAPPKYKLAVIGTGTMGQEHMRVTMMEGRATIHGIYDIVPSVMAVAAAGFEQFFPGQKPVMYKSLEECLNDPAIDGLVIATPNYTHLEVVKEVVKSKKHILLEKPMATTVADAAEIRDLANGYENVFKIGLQYRHKPIYAEAALEALERKAIGDIKTITILEHRLPFLDKVKQWNKFSKYSGGTLVEKCCHYFDLMNLFAGAKPVSVYATGGMAVNFKDFEYNNEKSDILDHAGVMVSYENGVRANFDLVMFAPMFYEEVTLCGDKGRIRAYENEDFLAMRRQATHFELLSGENGVTKISQPCYPGLIQASGHFGSTYYSHKYFVDALDGKPATTATADEGFWSVVVGAAAEESVKTGKIIKISDMI
ncbi:MAG: Gfo/Idh/MocA family oxidoreductase [Defluviitaleaceae bacterium]|nr:Gfo/Idh/MocA family oxidoreductase [Defluviitaleaceae bacterium]